MKELRTLKFISKVVLTKYQRFLLPHFKANLLNYVPKAAIHSKDEHLKEYLKRAIVRHKKSKIDKRMLKYINLSDDEDNQMREIINGSKRAHTRKVKPESQVNRKN